MSRETVSSVQGPLPEAAEVLHRKEKALQFLDESVISQNYLRQTDTEDFSPKISVVIYEQPLSSAYSVYCKLCIVPCTVSSRLD